MADRKLLPGFAVGRLSVVAPVTAVCSIAVPVLLARIVLRERPQPAQSVGLACAAVAIVLITRR